MRPCADAANFHLARGFFVFDFSYMLSVFPKIIEYLPVTLYLAVTSMVLAVLLGFVLALVTFLRIPVLHQIATAIISLFRSIPALVMLFLVYFGLPELFPALTEMGAMTAAILGLGVKESGYLAEIFRAAFNSVDRGQLEAGLAVGMRPWRIYLRYIIPQAAYIAIPATINIFISIIKETSVVFTLGVTEMFGKAKTIAGESFRYFEVYLMVGLIYWGIVVIITWIQNLVERRMRVPYER